jgi:hypothetical protein
MVFSIGKKVEREWTVPDREKLGDGGFYQVWSSPFLYLSFIQKGTR